MGNLVISQIPHQVVGGGIVFGWVGWALELKETMQAVLRPITKAGCKTWRDVFFTYLELDTSEFIGICVWVGISVVSTFALWKLIKFALTIRKIQAETPAAAELVAPAPLSANNGEPKLPLKRGTRRPGGRRAGTHAQERLPQDSPADR